MTKNRPTFMNGGLVEALSGPQPFRQLSRSMHIQVTISEQQVTTKANS